MHQLKLSETASEGKPCSELTSGTRSSSLHSPDISFSRTPGEQCSCLLESHFECSCPDGSVEDLLDLNTSLRDSEYFRDLQGSPADESHLSTLIAPEDRTQLICSASHRGSYRKNLPPPDSNMDQGSDQECEMSVDDSDMDSFPILVRSMSTSRRHSWDFPLSPVDLGRRFSLDTRSIDSDTEQDDQSHSHSSVEEITTSELTSTESRIPMVLYSRSDILASDEKSRAERASRILETSKLAAGEDHDSDDSLQSAEGQTHMAKRRTSSSERKDTANVTWYEFLSNSNQNDEEEDKVERAEKGTKVKRTFSSLKNRMTGSFSKEKGKSREREQQREKERERKREREGMLKDCAPPINCNGHQLVRGSFSSRATCSLCSKSLQKKHGLQCVNCDVNVHKTCKTLLPKCSNTKNKSRDSAQKKEAAIQSSNPATREPCLSTDGAVCPTPGMTVLPRRASVQQNAPSCHHNRSNTSSSSSVTGEMDEVDALKIKRSVEDAVSIAPSTTEAISLEDPYYVNVRAELELIAQDLEVESWSLAVDQQFLKKHSKETIKRQDVLYELMQTEMHHVRTLKIMLLVYMHELRETLQLEERRLECLFPRLENLLELHSGFLSRLRERRQDALDPGGGRNYIIQRLADLLIEQFSGELAEQMRECYATFCSRQIEAVAFYKEQLQNNKKFHNLIRKINSLTIVRRLGVPECILLVTQRITKYPVLLERLLQYTEAGTEEHEQLVVALSLIKGIIVQVDTQVSLYQKETRLREIVAKMEPKGFGKAKDGRIFRKEDVMQGKRQLLHEGTVNWKAASGRLKDIQAVLLTDVLLLLQEKDQRYVFSAVDGKPSVISLQKLIVREVAHEEKAMFLICASSNEPEMYEIHTSSKEERNTWITHIRQAVDSCPQTQERLLTEEEGARAQRFREIQERLTMKDAQIAQALLEKLELFSELGECAAGLEDMASPRQRLLLRGDSSDLQQGEQLLKGAITEVENLQNMLVSSVRAAPPPEDNPSSLTLPRRADTFGGYDSSVVVPQKNGSVKKHRLGSRRSKERNQRASSDPQLKEVCASQRLSDEHPAPSSSWSATCSNWKVPEAEIYDRVLQLSQSLYSLQAIVSQQDSFIELHQSSLNASERQHGTDILLEQEKQRNLEKQRAEMAHFQRVQAQQQQEQERWERERVRQRRQHEAEQLRLEEWESKCRRMEDSLAQEREKLESQKQKYQQDLERLRESTQAVEKERERLEQQKKMRKPPPYGQEATQLHTSTSFNGELSSLVGGDASRSLIRPSLSTSSVDYMERPDVPSRRESSAAMPIKTEVPIHLVSTTNQLHKQGGVQQQIPTKLALLKTKDKGSKNKGSQRTDSSASVDMKQILPMKLSARDSESSLKVRRSVSPHQQPPTPAPPTQPQGSDPLNPDRLPSEPLGPQNQNVSPPNPVLDEKEKEDVIFI